MSSNERPSPVGRPAGSEPPRPPVPESTLRTEKVLIERKTFILTLRENPRGRFVRITEDVGGRRDSIIVPATGLEDFRRALGQIAEAAAAAPPPSSGPD